MWTLSLKQLEAFKPEGDSGKVCTDISLLYKLGSLGRRGGCTKCGVAGVHHAGPLEKRRAGNESGNRPARAIQIIFDAG